MMCGSPITATRATVAVALGVLASNLGVAAQPPQESFAWPSGARAAVSFSFDDARESQLDVGVPLFGELATHVTFYLTGENVGRRAAGWRKAASAGHELANHTQTHPCTGNFPWSRTRALEDYTLERIRGEMLEANRVIEEATGVKPVTFAYPCGQRFVGRGGGVASYVPVVHELFVAGRGWLDEAPNDPAFVDLAQVLAYATDDREFTAIKGDVDDAIAGSRWIVFAGHDIGTTPGRQVTRVSLLRELTAYLRDPSRGVWVDTVAHVAEHVKRARDRAGRRP